MNHNFDVEIAKKYGIEEAILLQNIYFWIEKNRANNKHFYNDTYWTYNSKKAFADLFPYMTPRKIDYTLNKLIEEGLIITGCFNEDGRDRTLWYALTKMGYCILQNCEMQFTKMENVYNNNIYNNTNIKQSDINNNVEKSDIDKIFDFWNTLNINNHIKLNDVRKKAINNRLKDYSIDVIMIAMKHYEIILHDESYYWNYTWSIEDFLNRKNGFTTFLDDGSNWVSYENRNNNKNNPYSSKKDEISKETSYEKLKGKNYL